jgi:hypothetical protein
LANKFFELLNHHQVPFFIIGGHAVSFHGFIRTTEDIDIVWIRSPQAEQSLLEALQQIHAQWISDEIDPATKLETLVPVSEAWLKSTRLMVLITDYGFVDLFDYIPGCPDADVDQVFEQSENSNGTRYVSLPWLLQMKKAANRAQDQRDLEFLGCV